jgi:hypothetical protein
MPSRPSSTVGKSKSSGIKSPLRSPLTSARIALAAWAKPGSYRAGRWCAPTPRTCSSDGSDKLGCQRTIRLTHSGPPASRIFWKMTVLLKPLSASPATPTAGRQSFTTAAVRRCPWRTWSEFGIDCNQFIRKPKLETFLFLLDL